MTSNSRLVLYNCVSLHMSHKCKSLISHPTSFGTRTLTNVELGAANPVLRVYSFRQSENSHVGYVSTTKKHEILGSLDPRQKDCQTLNKSMEQGTHASMISDDTSVIPRKRSNKFQFVTSANAFISTISLTHLPTEILMEVFSHLDEIDATCLGLTSRSTYSIVVAIYGLKMSLAQHRAGPNSLERAWNPMGKQLCHHCGVYRCQLYRHIQEWINGQRSSLEYCSVAKKFVRYTKGQRRSCFRSKPSRPGICGRH